MNIQKFTKKDIVSCAELFESVFSVEPWNEPWTIKRASDRFSQFSKLPNFIGYAVRDKGQIIGFIGGFYEYWFEGKIFRLEELFVKKEYQNQKVGSSLILYLQNKLKQDQVKRIYLRTLKDSLQEKIYVTWEFTTNKTTIEMGKNI